jgi:PAS domain S-box-containing protein
VPQDSVIGKCIFDLLPAGLRESRRAMFDRVVRTRELVQFEDARDGRYFMHFVNPVLDAAGNVNRVAIHALEITERKQIESALARQEALYHTLFELSPDGIMLEDAAGRILDVNRALCQSFGYSREELLRQNVRKLVPAEDRPSVDTHLASLRGGQKLDHAVWNLRKNGERCLMRLTEKPLTMPDGSQGILVVARDITKSERAEMVKAVFLSLGAKLSSVRTPVEAARAIYAAADQLWRWDAATLSLYSPASDLMEPVLFCDVVDGQRREVAPPSAISPPSDRRRRIMREAAELFFRQQGDPELPETIRFGDVARPSETIMYAPMRRDGQPIGVLSIQSYTPGAYSPEDLRTLQALADYCSAALERLRAEQALQQREDLNRTIVATAMDGFFTLDFSVDPGGAIVEANDAYCRLIGYTREELLRLRIADLEAVESPEDIARHKARILATGADRFETRHRRKDGSEVQVELSVSRLDRRVSAAASAGAQPSTLNPPPAPAVERVFGFVRDITERKRAELAREAFLALGTRLNVARTALEAGRAIFVAADQFWDWHSATLDLCLPEMPGVQPILTYDIVDGQRQEVGSALNPQPSALNPQSATARMERILREGPQLILRRPPYQPEPGSVLIGDIGRPSKSLMVVPLRREDQPVGVLSIQSYNANAFTPADLRTLEALADHCSGALERIHAETALREDIAQRKQAEQTLAEALELNRTLISTSPVGIAAYQATGQCILANDALARITGGTLPQLLAQDFRALESWRRDGLLAGADAALQTGRPQTIETRSRTSFGREMNINAHLSPFSSQGQQHLLVMVTDITERASSQHLKPSSS